MSGKESINNELSKYIGFDLFKKDGSLNTSDIWKKGGKFLQCKPTSDVKIVEEENLDEIKIDWSVDNLQVYVPKEVQDKIRFYVSFVFGQFDQINDNINSLARDFSISRSAKIKTAQQDIRIYGDNLTDVRKSKLINSLNGLQDALNEIELKIQDTVQTVNHIPKDRISRIIKVNVKHLLEQEKIAHLNLCEYMAGIGTYIEISERLGECDGALECIERGIVFLQNILDDGVGHLEGWNEKKDRFWKEKPAEFLDLLKEYQVKALNSKKYILIKD